MKRVVVTGASGFVGANLARRLLRDGHEVHLLLRPGYQAWRVDALRGHAEPHEVLLHEPDSVGGAVGRIRPDWVFHLAASGAYSWQNDLRQMVRTNIEGTMNLVAACLKTGFEAFVNAGTSSEYGYKNTPPSETDFLEPNSHYAVTKAAATLFCRHTAQREQAPLTTLRLYSVYGAYEDANRFLPTLIRHALKGKLPPLVAPDTARDFVHVDDAVEAFLLAATTSATPGEVYNIGTGVQTTIADAVEVARRVLGVAEEPVWGSMANRSWDTHSWVADNRHAVDKLGWRPRHNFESGFKAMAEWLQGGEGLLAAYEQMALRKP